MGGDDAARPRTAETVCSLLGVLPIGADRSEADHGQGWRVAPSRATRAQRAPLTVILLGSRLGLRGGWPFSAEAGSAGVAGAQPVTGDARGSARAAARRVPQVQRRSCQPGCRETPAGASRPPPERARPLP